GSAGGDPAETDSARVGVTIETPRAEEGLIRLQPPCQTCLVCLSPSPSGARPKSPIADAGRAARTCLKSASNGLDRPKEADERRSRRAGTAAELGVHLKVAGSPEFYGGFRSLLRH